MVVSTVVMVFLKVVVMIVPLGSTSRRVRAQMADQVRPVVALGLWNWKLLQNLVDQVAETLPVVRCRPC